MNIKCISVIVRPLVRASELQLFTLCKNKMFTRYVTLSVLGECSWDF